MDTDDYAQPVGEWPALPPSFGQDGWGPVYATPGAGHLTIDAAPALWRAL